jgi:hypothetical protein
MIRWLVNEWKDLLYEIDRRKLVRELKRDGLYCESLHGRLVLLRKQQYQAKLGTQSE